MWLTFFAIHCALSGTFCFVNVVLDKRLGGKTAMGAAPKRPEWSAAKAVDGNTDQSYISNSCALTNYDDRNTSIWWKVWLQRQFSIAYLEIYFRSDTFQRSSGFSIYTYDTQNFDPLHDPKHLIYHHDPLSGCPSQIMNVTVNNVTQGIVLINERLLGYRSNCLGDNLAYTGIELCEIKVMGCTKDRYSSGCAMVCPSTCKNTQCDVFNGSCIHGCSDPNALTVDCIVCADGTYIENKTCLKCDGHCKNGTCNKLSRQCENGCNEYWTGEFCQKCSPYYYGSDCRTRCGQCRGDDVCNNLTGYCPKGCKPHWKGPRCDVCSPHYYGNDCNTPCGQCRGDDVCNYVTGHCPHVCKPHWTGSKCDVNVVCPPYFYGNDCSIPCGHCRGDVACNNVTGYCPEGCKQHWQGLRCNECVDGFYDNNCMSSCGHCSDGRPCDKITGYCLSGCESKFQLPFCQVCEDGYFRNSWAYWFPSCKECEDGFFGRNCIKECGHCKDSLCDKKTGYCLKGCETVLQPPFCKANNTDIPRFIEFYIHEKSNKKETALYVAIGILTALLVLSVGVIIHQRRQISGFLDNRRQTDNAQSPAQSQNYDNVTSSEDVHVYTTLDSVK